MPDNESVTAQPRPRRILILTAALGAGLLAAATAGPAVVATASSSPNGPSLDHYFRLEAGPNLSRDSAAALAAAPAGTDPAAFDYAALQAAKKLPGAAANRTWKEGGKGGGIVEDASRGALVEGRIRDTGIVLS